MMRTTNTTWAYALFMLSLAALACSGGATSSGETTSSGVSVGGAGSGTTSTTSQTGAGGASTSTTGTTGASTTGSGATGGMGGMGGAGGGGGMPPTGHDASDQVSAGHVMSSAGYTVHFTMGQPTLNQTTLSSETYRLRGGLVGATEKLP